MPPTAKLALLLALAPTALAAQQPCSPCVARLTNGYSMHCLSYERGADVTRLRLGAESYVDVANAQIRVIEQDDSPTEAPAPAAQDAAAPEPSRAPSAKNAPTLNREAINRLIAENGRKLGVDEEFIKLVVQQESGYNPRARSPKGARGLMQLMPATAARLGVNDAYDARQNVQGGAQHLRYLLALYHGDAIMALAAYNAGEAAVARYGGVPPYAETRAYIARIVAAYNRKLRAQQTEQQQPAPRRARARRARK